MPIHLSEELQLKLEKNEYDLSELEIREFSGSMKDGYLAVEDGFAKDSAIIASLLKKGYIEPKCLSRDLDLGLGTKIEKVGDKDPRGHSIIRDALYRAIRRREERISDSKTWIGTPDGAKQLTSGSGRDWHTIVDAAGDSWQIRIDKRKWKMSIPRDKETENEVTIVFDRKKDTE